MKKLNKAISVKRATEQTASCECNYQNNYYGDQACIVHKKVTKK